MLILSKYKDFYDYLCHQYKDEKKVIDRRNATIADGKFLYLLFNRATPYRMFDAVFNERHNTEYVLSLQIGYSVKCFQVIDIIYKKCSWDYEILLKYIEDKIADTPKLMEIKGFRITSWGYQTELFSENGVFIISFFAPFYTAEEVYKNLDDYFVYQQRDIGSKPIPTDKEKIVNHGFDIKTSFRKKSGCRKGVNGNKFL